MITHWTFFFDYSWRFHREPVNRPKSYPGNIFHQLIMVIFWHETEDRRV